MSLPFQTSLIPIADDQALSEVRDFLLAKPELFAKVGSAIRKAFDEVIDGPRTGRYCIEQLDKTEKTYIGTKVEILLRAELQLQRGNVLDNSICGHEVDTKFTVGGTWMIPREAVNELCLLVKGDDNAGTFHFGLLRMVPEVLTAGVNQDGKKSVSALGKMHIMKLVEGRLPQNFMLHLPPIVRNEVMGQANGRQAIKALFTHATGRLIPRTVIEQVAQQKDPLKRAREMKAILALEGIQVLCATYKEDRMEFERHGFAIFEDDDWLSMPMGN